MRKCIVLTAVLGLLALPVLPGFAQVIVVGSQQDANIEATLGNLTLGTIIPQYLMVNWANGTDSEGLIQFDVSAVPTGSTVSSAAMTLFQEANGQSAGTTVDAFRNTSAWNESTVTFNTKPSTAAGAVSSLNIGDLTAGVFRTWDLTSVVQGWVNGTFSNFGLTLIKNPNQVAWPYFNTKEEAIVERRPSLTVNFSAPAQVPEPSSLALVACGAAGLFLVRRRKTG